MALVLKDRVKETTITVGTSTLALLGAASGFQSFSSIGNGNTTYYAIDGGAEWEVGIGTYTSSGTTLSRDTVLASSAGGTTKVTFSAGTKNVFVTYPAGKAIYGDDSGLAYARISGYTTTATATGTTALTSASTYHQYFTGTLTQIVTLPLNTTIQNGWSFHIANNSTGNLTVNSNSGALVATVLPTTTVHVTCIDATINTAAAWDYGVTDFNSSIPIALGGTGQTTANTALNALLPTQTSNANKFLKTDGTNTSWGAAGLAWQSVQSANFTATSNNGYPVNSTAGVITVTLPASPTAGDVIVITDYAGTAGTNAIGINPNGLKINSTAATFYMTSNRYSGQLTYIDSTQGWLFTGGVTGTIASSQYTVTYFLLAGGAAGSGGGYSGGGGAGGVLASTFTANIGTTYTLTIGGGGAANTGGVGQSGSNSTIAGSGLTTITAIGGGGGGGGVGASGGSGGGGGSGVNAGGAGTSGQGFAGGTGFGGTAAVGAGGGGGASQAGGNGSGSAAGNGGNGTTTSLTGTSVAYAGGGGGGVYQSGTRGVGGTGGGTNGGANVAAAANSGSGTGGGTQAGILASAAAGSGVVILSMPTTNYGGTANLTGTYTTGTNGSNTWVRWTQSGTFKG